MNSSLIDHPFDRSAQDLGQRASSHPEPVDPVQAALSAPAQSAGAPSGSPHPAASHSRLSPASPPQSPPSQSPPSQSPLSQSGLPPSDPPVVGSHVRDSGDASATLIRRLQQQIDSVETGQRNGVEQGFGTGAGPLDRLLPGGRVARGSLVEWISSGGGDGSDVLAWLTARQAAMRGGAIVVIDPHGRFYPPTSLAWRVDFRRLVVLRPGDRGSVVGERGDLPCAALGGADDSATAGAAQGIVATPRQRLTDQDWMWAVDQSLRCPAVAAVWARLARIDERWFRRFQLSAEASGCVGVFVRPAAARQQPSWSDIRWEVQPLATASELAHHRRLRVRLARCRGGRSGQVATLAIDSVDGSIHDGRKTICKSGAGRIERSAVASGAEFVAAQLAHPAARRRARRA